MRLTPKPPLWLALAGCQSVIGLEEREPYPDESEAVPAFGQAEEIGHAGERLTDLTGDASRLYALSPKTRELLAFTEGSDMPVTIEGDLDEPRGLALDDGSLFLTARRGIYCEVIAVDPSGNSIVILSELFISCFVAVGAADGLAVASTGDEVRSDKGGGDGTRIGKAYDGSSVPAVIVAEGRYFWIDADSGELLRSEGQSVDKDESPPGKPVSTVAVMTEAADLAASGGQVFVVGGEGVGRAPASATDASFTILTTETSSPRGLSVDDTHVYWADGSSVRAVPIGAEGAVPTILYDGSDEPSDTFARGDAVFFTTMSGKLFRVRKTVP